MSEVTSGSQADRKRPSEAARPKGHGRRIHYGLGFRHSYWAVRSFAGADWAAFCVPLRGPGAYRKGLGPFDQPLGLIELVQGGGAHLRTACHVCPGRGNDSSSIPPPHSSQHPTDPPPDSLFFNKPEVQQFVLQWGEAQGLPACQAQPLALPRRAPSLPLPSSEVNDRPSAVEKYLE